MPGQLHQGAEEMPEGGPRKDETAEQLVWEDGGIRSVIPCFKQIADGRP